MATDKRAYELKAGVTRVSFGSELTLEQGDVYETSEPWEINELEAHPDVKTADKSSKKAGS